MTKGSTNKKYNDNKIENNFYIKKKKKQTIMASNDKKQETI